MSAPITTLIISPGGIVRGLYTDALDLQSLGNLRMRRASVVEFKHSTQQWEVRTPNGKHVLFANRSREKCLNWERNHFTQ